MLPPVAAAHAYSLYIHSISLYDCNINILSIFHEYFGYFKVGACTVNPKNILVSFSACVGVFLLSMHLRVELLGHEYLYHYKKFFCLPLLLPQTLVLLEIYKY